jgi:hypothetical protein
VQIASLVFGISAILGVMVGFIPCLGALNWLNIPFAVVGSIVSVVALTQENTRPKGKSVAGLILCIVAILVGGVRLVLGGGIL